MAVIGGAGRVRRPRGALANSVRSTFRLSQDATDVADRASAALGITRDAYLDELLRREATYLDEGDRPRWWNKPAPGDQKELPLKSA